MARAPLGVGSGAARAGTRARRAMRRTAAAAALTLLAIGGTAGIAHAEQYTVQPFQCGSNWSSGQTDSRGYTYVACGWQVYIYDATGVRRSVVNLPSASADVAPSPDGSVLYFYYGRDPGRMVRQADGSYRHDAAWRAEGFIVYGTFYTPKGIFMATDGAGNLYVSNGSWTPNAPNMILKYTPAGRLVTRFGDWGEAVGSFRVNMGLMVSKDGSTIYTVESTMSRVQRFVRNADGSYRFAQTWGTVDADHCRTGYFAAPYDVGIDHQDNVYVLDTSCERVQKFTATGQFITSMRIGIRSHGMTVDNRGNVYVGENNMLFVRPGVNVPQPQLVNVAANYVGWAQVDNGGAAVPVWRWTANGWQAMTMPSRTRVWAHPFAAGWTWIWKDNAWHATYSRHVYMP